MAPPGDDDGNRPERGVDRRRVLQLLMGGSTAVLAGMAAAPVASYLRPLALPEAEAVAAIDDSLGLWEARQVVVAGRPVLVVRTNEGVRAFSAICTHLGCVVKWRKGRREFFCPCHGARFDAEGRVRGGPAPRSLARLEVSEEPGAIVVRKT